MRLKTAHGTKRLVTRKKNLNMDNPDRVKDIVRSLFSQVEAFRDRTKVPAWSDAKIFSLSKNSKERAGGLKPTRLRGSMGWQTKSSKRWSHYIQRSFWKALTAVFGRESSLANGRGRDWVFSGKERNLWRMPYPINRWVLDTMGKLVEKMIKQRL